MLRRVRDLEVARAFRALRQRRGWRQTDVARRVRLSQGRVSDLERGHLDSFTLRTLRQLGLAVEMDISLIARWRGGELARLLDRDHAALQNELAQRLQGLGWEVVPERTFSQFGERGSIDLVAFHLSTQILLVVEVKTVIADIQDLLSRLDAKSRLASVVVRDLGWRPSAVVPCLAVTATNTSRRRIAEHRSLFERLAVRGPAARAWLRAPRPVSGLLLSISAPGTPGTGVRRAGQQRVRLTGRRRPQLSVLRGEFPAD